MSQSASYTGRIAPPSMPKMVSTFWFSRDWIRAFAPDILVMFAAPFVTYGTLSCLGEGCLWGERVAGGFRGLPEQNGERILHRGDNPSRSFLQGIYYPYPSRMKIKRLRYPRKLRNLLEKSKLNPFCDILSLYVVFCWCLGVL